MKKEISDQQILVDQQEREREWAARLEHAHMQSYLHHYGEAESEYRKLLEINPSSIEIKGDLASLLYYQKKYTEALALLDTISEEKKDDKIRLLLADIDLSLNNYLEAEVLYREQINKHPQDQETRIKLAKLLSWQKKYDEAIQLYQQILANDPHNIPIRRQYAIVLIWMGKHAEGAEELKKTLPEENLMPVNSSEEKKSASRRIP